MPNITLGMMLLLVLCIICTNLITVLKRDDPLTSDSFIYSTAISRVRVSGIVQGDLLDRVQR